MAISVGQPGGAKAGVYLSQAERFLQQAMVTPGLDESIRQGLQQCLDQVIHPALQSVEGQASGDMGAGPMPGMEPEPGEAPETPVEQQAPASDFKGAMNQALQNLKQTGSYKKGAKASDAEVQPVDEAKRKARLKRMPAKA